MSSKVTRKQEIGILLGLSLAVRLLTAWAVQQPGYTDAYYYAVGASQLAAGEGLSEPFIWNYLDPPDEVPHPGYRYWMPLASLLGGLSMLGLGDSFRAMQLPFIVTSALVPLVAYAVAHDVTGRRRHAVLAALLAIFAGFYAHVLVLPDSFAPFALAGSLCLWAAGRGLCDEAAPWFGLAGLAAGLAHLARADGLLLAGIVLVATLMQGRPTGKGACSPRGSARRVLTCVALAVAGYGLIMGPWFARNVVVLGSPLPGAGLRTAFLTDYDDMFAYGQPLTLSRYLAWGWDAILRSKIDALAINLQRLLVESLQVFLLPLVALGMWRLRHNRLLWPFFLYLPLLFVVMTFVFTFPGMRGGLFHSGGALLPFFFAMAGPGLEVAVRWAARRLRRWHANQAWAVFGAGLVGLALVVTGFALWRAGVLTGDWNRRHRGYEEVGQWLAEQGESNAVVMAGDAPAFVWHTGYIAVAVPNSPLDTVVAVAERYGARYLVLDASRPRTTDPLFRREASHPRLSLRHVTQAATGDLQLYEVLP
jgi:hypothetical protein